MTMCIKIIFDFNKLDDFNHLKMYRGTLLRDLGCWADGLHEECRFCGTAPYVTECSEDAKALFTMKKHVPDNDMTHDS